MKKVVIQKNQKVRQSNHLIESPYAQEFSVHEIKIFEIAIASFVQEDINLFYGGDYKEGDKRLSWRDYGNCGGYRIGNLRYLQDSKDYKK